LPQPSDICFLTFTFHYFVGILGQKVKFETLNFLKQLQKIQKLIQWILDTPTPLPMYGCVF
jgi:hypothetical protein